MMSFDLLDEVIFGEPEQVAGCLAAVDADPVSAIISMNSGIGGMSSFPILRSWSSARASRQGASQGREVQSRVADRGHLDVLVALWESRRSSRQSWPVPWGTAGTAP